jgi:peroxiredoxin
VIVLNVWASWCQECRKESRGLGRLSAALNPATVRFVGIDEHDTNDSGRAYATASGMTFPQLVDPDGALLAKLRLLPSYGIPSTLVIDRSGRMAGRIIGAADETVLRSLIERVAADH